MLRPALFAAAVVALIAPVRAADPDLSGNWLLTTVTPAGESAVCILKVEMKDGKPAARVLFSPPNVETTVRDFRVTDTGVTATVKQSREIQGRPSATELAFVGVRGKDAKQILGSTGDNRFRTRAKLTATDKETLAPADLVIRTPLPEPMQQAQQLGMKATQAQIKLLNEKDAEKKAELQKEYTAAAREASEKQPALYRETVEKHPDSPAALDAALNVVRASARQKLTPDEAGKLVAVIRKHAEPYGPLFAGVTLAPIAGTLANQPGLAEVAVAAIEPSATALTDADPASIRAAVLGAYQNALAKAGKADEAKGVAARLEKLEAAIDAEYLKTVPPFKPTAYAGRKDRAANQVAVLELFTGAECPPCVAADVAFDALLKAYKPTDLVLIQYHMHIPGPDPLTNPDTVARWDYYRKQFPEGIRGTPSTLFNGKPAAGGGGGMANAEAKFGQYAGLIDPILEKTTDVKLAGKATRDGDTINIAVEATNADGDDMKLRLLLVEENVRYVGGNQLRFHHQVVRAMPGGADGVAVNDKTFKHAATVDLAEVRKNLNKYLDDYAANTRPFPRADRPMEMKGLRVIALVQNDKTREIAQAVQIDVEGRPAAGAGGQ
jgi:hypothetical protein